MNTRTVAGALAVLTAALLASATGPARADQKLGTAKSVEVRRQKKSARCVRGGIDDLDLAGKLVQQEDALGDLADWSCRRLGWRRIGAAAASGKGKTGEDEGTQNDRFFQAWKLPFNAPSARTGQDFMGS